MDEEVGEPEIYVEVRRKVGTSYVRTIKRISLHEYLVVKVPCYLVTQAINTALAEVGFRPPHLASALSANADADKGQA